MASSETPPPPALEAEAEPAVETPVPEAEPEHEKVEEAPPEEVDKAVEPPPEVITPAAAPPIDYLALAEVVLRFLLVASSVVAVVVIVTSKETKHSKVAKFKYSPAFIYFVAALSVAGLYSIITALLSFYALLKPGCFPQILSRLVIIDLLLVGIVGAASGCAGAIAYTGLKGNSHLGWGKVCDVFDKYCTYVAVSVAASLFASAVLALLVLLSLYSLSNKIPN